MKPEIINRIRELGYRVYMRSPNDSYLYYTEAIGGRGRIAYLQDDGRGNVTLHTVHKPNRESGTGFRVAEWLADPLTRDELELGFDFQPSWWRGPAPQKFKSIEDFRAANDWNAEFHEVTE